MTEYPMTNGEIPDDPARERESPDERSPNWAGGRCGGGGALGPCWLCRRETAPDATYALIRHCDAAELSLDFPKERLRGMRPFGTVQEFAEKDGRSVATIGRTRWLRFAGVGLEEARRVLGEATSPTGPLVRI